MKIAGYSAEQLRAAEAPHLAAGVPLMQRAAAGLAREIRRLLEERVTGRPARVLLLVGSGNNGADALFAGALLARDGIEVHIAAAGIRMHDAALAAAREAGAQLVESRDVGAAAASADVVVDGILGTGTSAAPALRGPARAVVSAVRPVLDVDARPLVVAVDIPSGIDPDGGAVSDQLVLPADLTVTFGGYKAGLLLPPASTFAGRIVLINIGLGPDLAAMEPLIVINDEGR